MTIHATVDVVAFDADIIRIGTTVTPPFGWSEQPDNRSAGREMARGWDRAGRRNDEGTSSGAPSGPDGVGVMVGEREAAAFRAVLDAVGTPEACALLAVLPGATPQSARPGGRRPR